MGCITPWFLFQVINQNHLSDIAVPLNSFCNWHRCYHIRSGSEKGITEEMAHTEVVTES